MIPITVVLRAEHKMFRGLFDHIQKVLPTVEERAEVKHLARLCEGMLRNHDRAQEELSLRVHHRAAKLPRRNGRLHRHHQDINDRLNLVYVAKDVAQARTLLQAVLVASRKYFKYEERVFFPLVEKSIEPKALEKLGTVWVLRHYSPEHWTV
jgi:hypothetical protein